MRILKVALTIVALAAPVASANAQEGTHEVNAAMVGSGGSETAKPAADALATDKGWDATWALLFQLNNPFSNAGSFIGMFNNTSVGIEYFLTPDTAARFGVYYNRYSNPRGTRKLVTDSALNHTETYAMAGAGNSGNYFLARADYLMRLMPRAVAPYAGAGVFYDYDTGKTNYVDDQITTPNQVTTVNNWYTTHNLGLRGILGAEWRVHGSFSFFAEYALSLTVLQQYKEHNETDTEVTIDGERTVTVVKDDMSRPRWLNFGSALTHAANLGLAIHF